MRTRIVASTLLGSLTCNAALLVLAQRRGLKAVQGVNCTAHWLVGPEAAQKETVDLKHSATGIATNVGALLFWSVLYDLALGKKTGRARALLVTAALGPVAALADYKATPKRFTPGWELVFSKKEMGLVYLAMVIGMALGARRGQAGA